MKNRAGAIAKAGVPQVSVAVDAYFPRSHLIDCLRTMQEEFPTAAINLRITTMQGGENLVLEKVCALAVTIENVPEVNPQAIERHWLREVRSEEHTSELQSLMRISYAVFCLQKKTQALH